MWYNYIMFVQRKKSEGLHATLPPVENGILTLFLNVDHYMCLFCNKKEKERLSDGTVSGDVCPLGAQIY